MTKLLCALVVLVAACVPASQPEVAATDPVPRSPAAQATAPTAEGTVLPTLESSSPDEGTEDAQLVEEPWTLVGVSADGLEVHVGFEASGVASGCTAFGDVTARESADAVEITIRSLQRSTGACTEELVLIGGVARLDRPLGDRALGGCGHGACDELGAGTELRGDGVDVTTDALGLAAMDGMTVAIAGRVRSGFEAENVPPPEEVSGIVALDVRDGSERWATPFAREDADDPLAHAAWSDGAWVVGELTASGGQVFVEAASGRVAALQNGFSLDVADQHHGRWFGIQKLTQDLVAVDPARVAAAWTGAGPIDFGAGEEWRVTGEYVVGASGPAIATVAGDQLRLRSAGDGVVVGGGPLPAGAAGIEVADDRGAAMVGADLVGFVPSTAAERWRTALPGEVGTLHISAAGILVVGPQSLALVDDAGALRWTASVVPVAYHARAGNADPPVAVAASTVVVSAADGTVLALDAQTGTERWRSPIADDQRRPVARGGVPVILDDVVVVSTWSGAVAYALDDGRALWSAGFADALSS